MKKLCFQPLPTAEVRKYQKGELDAYGHPPEVQISDGQGNPCRHCLDHIKDGEEMLVLAYRPFLTKQPYAELGPIFLHSSPCNAYTEASTLPRMYQPNGKILLRGYNKSERIVYGTGEITQNSRVEETANRIFQNPDVKFIHARSASNNCFQYKISMN